MVTGFEEQILRSISRQELFEAFAKWDTDATGKISFENFVTGAAFRIDFTWFSHGFRWFSTVFIVFPMVF